MQLIELPMEFSDVIYEWRKIGQTPSHPIYASLVCLVFFLINKWIKPGNARDISALLMSSSADKPYQDQIEMECQILVPQRRIPRTAAALLVSRISSLFVLCVSVQFRGHNCPICWNTLSLTVCLSTGPCQQLCMTTLCLKVKYSFLFSLWCLCRAYWGHFIRPNFMLLVFVQKGGLRFTISCCCGWVQGHCPRRVLLSLDIKERL